MGGGADGDTWWPSRRALLTCTRRKRRRWSRWCVASDIYGFLPCVWITNLSFSTFRFLRHVTRRPILRPLLPPLLFPPSIPLTACPDTHPHTPPPPPQPHAHLNLSPYSPIYQIGRNLTLGPSSSSQSSQRRTASRLAALPSSP